MKNKKLYAILGLSAIAANLGYASLVMAQGGTSTIIGTQTIDCGTHSLFFLTGYTPDSFSFPSIAIPVANYTTATLGLPDDMNDSIRIQSNSAANGCPNNGVSLKIQAVSEFLSGGTIPLQSTGNGARAMLSLAIGEAMPANATFIGTHTVANFLLNDVNQNAFLNNFSATPKYGPNQSANAVLIDSNGCIFEEATPECSTNNAKEIIAFEAAGGLYAWGDPAGNYYEMVQDYVLALPHSVPQGTFQAQILWTLTEY